MQTIESDLTDNLNGINVIINCPVHPTSIRNRINLIGRGDHSSRHEIEGTVHPVLSLVSLPYTSVGSLPITISCTPRVSYVVNAGDLILLTPGNRFCKYADDTCLDIPASNIDSRTEELDSIRT